MRIPGLRSRQSPVYWTGVFNCFRPVLKRTKPDSNVSLLPPGGASSVPLPFYSSKVPAGFPESEEHTSELQSRGHLVCRLLLEKKKKRRRNNTAGTEKYERTEKHDQWTIGRTHGR